MSIISDVTDITSRFRQDGFVLLENFLPPEEATRLDREIDRYLREILPTVNNQDVFYESGNSGPISQTGSLEVYDNYFKNFTERPDIIEVVEACLATPVRFLGAELFFKFPRVGSATPYHQDNAYMHFEPAVGAACWISVDDTSIENGAMHYPAGAFKLGDLNHFETGVLPFSKQLREGDLDLKAHPEVPAALKRGGMAIHHILTPHRAGPNFTDHCRRGFVINYAGINAQVNGERFAAHSAYIQKIHEELGNT